MVVNGDIFTDYGFERLSLDDGVTRVCVGPESSPQHPRG